MISRGALLILAILVVGWSKPSDVVAQPIGVFVGQRSSDSPERLQAFVNELVTELGDRRATSVPQVFTPVTASTQELEQYRALGSAAFGELAEGQPNDQLIQAYDERFKEALTRASHVRDPANRAMLWNLCLLRVQLLARKGDDALTRDAVKLCRRNFVDLGEINETWPEGVSRAFAQHDQSASHVTLEVKSSPPRCTVLLYGGAVGTTPLRLAVEPGQQEVELSCNGRSSKLHRFRAEDDMVVTIWLAGDDAAPGTGAATWLVYRDDAGFKDVDEHALAFAQESHNITHALVTESQKGFRVVLYEDGRELQSGEFSSASAPSERRAAIQSFLGGQRVASHQEAERTSLSWLGDGLLGGTLAIVGGSLLVYPIRSFRVEGDCADDTCERKYEGKTPATLGLFAAGTALATTGLLVLAWKPLARRKHALSLQAGFGDIRVRGTF